MSKQLPKGIFKRGGSYSIRYSVPTHQRAKVGRKEVVRTLSTNNLEEAIHRADEVLQAIVAENHQMLAGAIASAQASTTISATSKKWLDVSDGLSQASRRRYQAILADFCEFSGNIEVANIDRDLSLRFFDWRRQTPSKKTGELLSKKSIQAYQLCLASYWRVLDHWGLVNPDKRNPFSSLMRRVPGQKITEDPRKKNLRPVTRTEAEDLLRFINENRRLSYRWEMHVTIKLLWVTACRLNEIASLTTDRIVDPHDHMVLHIVDAKTTAGNRDVYVVGREECGLIRKAIAKAAKEVPLTEENEGMLFPRLRRGGYDRKASHNLGKLLGRARELSVSQAGRAQDGSVWDMHSFRRMGISALINAGVDRGARNLAVGHSNSDDIGLAIYARRGDLSNEIRKAFENLHKEIGGGLRVPLENDIIGRYS